jgi:integrase/recombinase XerD
MGSSGLFCRFSFIKEMAMKNDKGFIGGIKGWQYYIEDLLDDYREYLEAVNRSKKTITGYMDSLVGFSKFLRQSNLHKPIYDLGRSELQSYVLHLKGRDRWADNLRISKGGKLSAYTVFAYVRDIKVFRNWLKKERYINRNPLASFPLPKVPKLVMPTLNHGQIKKLLGAIDRSTPRGSMYYSIIVLFLDTGIRLSGLINVKLKDINLDGKYIKVWGKGQKERLVPIVSVTRKLLVDYINNHRSKLCHAESEYLYPNQTGGAIPANTVEQFFRRLAKACGLDDIKFSPHVLRHTFATNSVANGANIETLRNILGHESIQTTVKYTHMRPEDIKKQHSRFSPVAKLFLSKS